MKIFVFSILVEKIKIIDTSNPHTYPRESTLWFRPDSTLSTLSSSRTSNTLRFVTYTQLYSSSLVFLHCLIYIL